MLQSVLEYGAIRTKVCALRAKFLTKSDYETMCQMNDVASVVRYLKTNTSYRTVLATRDEMDIHRSELEHILHEYLGNIYKKLFNFTKGNSRKFFEYVFLRNEIEIMKRILRSLETKSDAIDEESLNPFLMEHSTVDYHRLLKATNIHEFISALSNSAYYKLLSPFLTNTEHLNVFSVEMTLDMYYFRYIQKNIKKLLSGSSKKAISESMGAEIDMLNIMWIYRCKKYYEAPVELIFTYIIPYKRRLNRDSIKEMVKAKTMNEFCDIVREKTPYGELVNDIDHRFIEENFHQMMYKANASLGRKYPYSLAAITTYIHLLEIDNENIITLVEGVRYHVDKTELRQHLRF